jgi:hypothetical protein
VNPEVHVIGPTGPFRVYLKKLAVPFSAFPMFEQAPDVLMQSLSIGPDTFEERLSDRYVNPTDLIGAVGEIAERYQDLLRPQPEEEGRYLAVSRSVILVDDIAYPDFGGIEQAKEMLRAVGGVGCRVMSSFLVIPPYGNDIPYPFMAVQPVSVRRIRPADLNWLTRSWKRRKYSVRIDLTEVLTHFSRENEIVKMSFPGVLGGIRESLELAGYFCKSA